MLLAGAAIACDEHQSLGLDPVPMFSVSAAPSNARSFAISQSQIQVNWQDNSPNESGFEVHRSITGAGGPFVRLASTGPAVASHSDEGLAPSTEYCYRVRAFRITGKSTVYSEFSNVTCTRTLGPPEPPANLSATPPFSSAVDVTWSDKSSTENGFRVERAAVVEGPWAAVVSTGPNVTWHHDWGRTSEQQVCYRVIAFNAVGDSPPSNTDCTMPPAGPTNLIADSVDAQTVDLAWTDNSGVEDGYEVLRAAGSGPWGAVAQLPANSTSYRDGGATSNVTYSYQVRANRDGGFSDVSNTATVAGSCVPMTVEQCDNGLDDECDGLVDTDDDDCQCFAHACPEGFVCDGWSGLCYRQPGDDVQNGDESVVECGGQSISGGQS
jgi:titin